MLYQSLLNKIVEKSIKIFKGNLIGIYLHGSLAMGCFNPDKSDIDLIIVIRNNITDIQKLQFMDYIHKMNGTDKDLAAHFKIIKKYGVVLQGEVINNVFDDVPRKDYIDSIWLDVEGAKKDILEEPVYVILNLCRVAAFLKNDLILSKKQGGEWALQNLSTQYHTLISNAV